jgi:zinc transport system substrate-binding protein
MKTLAALLLLSATSFAADGKLQVAVSNYPLKYFAERIGGAQVSVLFPVPKDEDPAFWKPTDAEVQHFQQADLILMNGATYSKWADKATLPRSKTIDTSASFKDKFIVIPGAVTHSHGPGGEHSHSGTSFTTWIDFSQAIAQADAVRAAFAKKKPDAAAEFEKNFSALRADIEALDKRLLEAGKKLGNQPVVASHPVYHYFARRYALNLKNVLWEPEEVPTDAQMAELKTLLATHAAKWMIWEGEPAKESVEKIKALGLQSTVFDPCGNVPEKGDWLSMMQSNVANMEAIAGP